MRRPILIAVTFILSGLVVGPDAASAAPAPNDCKVTEDKVLDCGVDVVTPGGTDSQPANPTGSAGTSGPVWTKDNKLDTDHKLGMWRFCQAGADMTVTGGLGVYQQYSLTDPVTAQVLDRKLVCVPLNPDGTPAEAPPPPPAPPSVEEIRAAAPIPQLVITANPGRGLAGMESRFWVNDPGPLTVAVDLRGWTVTGTLTAGNWNWNTGDGASHRTATAGSAEQPSASHVYETKQIWHVSVGVSWTGSYTVSGYGTSFTQDGLSTSGASTLDYEVIEVRGVVDQP